jgi:hypothetical protein
MLAAPPMLDDAPVDDAVDITRIDDLLIVTLHQGLVILK